VVWKTQCSAPFNTMEDKTENRMTKDSEKPSANTVHTNETQTTLNM